MADKPDAQVPEMEEDAGSRKSAIVDRLRGLLGNRWVVIIIVATLALHGVGFTAYQLFAKSASGTGGPEVALGDFHFEADSNEQGRIVRAELCLYVALLDELAPAAKRRLETHKHRVRQDIEELFREAHAGDFDDPKLRELKRQLQAQVNKTLDLRMNVVSSVIITHLELTPNPKRSTLGLPVNQGDTAP